MFPEYCCGVILSLALQTQTVVRENNTETTTGPQARIEKINSISTLLETREGFGLDSLGSLGLGFRAAMPKMPSFRKVVSSDVGGGNSDGDGVTVLSIPQDNLIPYGSCVLTSIVSPSLILDEMFW